MLICPRDIYREVHGILDPVIAVGGHAHEISSARLALSHVTDGLLHEFTLGEYAYNQHAVFDQADSTML